MPSNMKSGNKRNSGRRGYSSNSGPKIIKTSSERVRPAIPRANNGYSRLSDKRRKSKFDILDFFGGIVDFLGAIGDWCAQNVKQAIIGVIVLVVLVATLVAVLVVGKDKHKEKEADQENVEATDELEIPEVSLEKDAVSSINDLISSYYTALAEGDTSTINGMRNTDLDDTERVKIEMEAKYIDSYENIEVYTKPGLNDNTYVVFVYSEAKLDGFDTLVPELKTYVVYPDGADGYELYEGELSDDEEDYLVGLSGQDDVVNLCNTVQAKYNEAVESDSELAEFLSTFAQTINNDAGEALANLEYGEEAEETDEDTTPQIVVKEVEAKDTVNVRKSDSENADKLGKLSAGTRVPLIEKKDNGWSKVEFEGQEAYVKTEFLVDVLSTLDGDDESDGDGESEGGLGSSGKVTAKDTVNVRKTASTDSEKVGSLTAGTTVDFVGTEGEWSKIKFNGDIAYVKSEFLE